jgi:hypothetical protein
MFCDGCGVAMAAEQQFCGACGKQIGVAPAARPGGAIAGDGRVAKHLTTVAALWIAVAALTLLVAVVLLAIGIFPFDRFIPRNLGLDDAATASGVATVTGLIHTLFLIGGIVVLAIAVVHFVAAWGLFHYAPWARILTIAFAFLRVLEVPYGTALAIYTIWVLMGPSSEREYRALRPA